MAKNKIEEASEISLLSILSLASFIATAFIAFQLAPNFIFTIQYKSYLLRSKKADLYNLISPCSECALNIAKDETRCPLLLAACCQV